MRGFASWGNRMKRVIYLALAAAVVPACGGGSSGGAAPFVHPWGAPVYTDAGGGGGAVYQDPANANRIALRGTFLADLNIDVQFAAATRVVLETPIIIGDNVPDGVGPTLTIGAGTTVFGEPGTSFPSMLLITRSAKIIADGTAASPIVFTSSQPVGTRAFGDWGGIVINGRSQVNTPDPQGEGNSGTYGMNPPVLNDNSGILRYVRIEFAGKQFSSLNELNGIAFQGVGSGTTVEFVQCHRCADDGMEFFGGTVNVKNIVITGADDDGFDWTGGWTGRAQFVVIQQYSDSDNGIEADNNNAGNDALPRSKPILANFTIMSTTVGSGLGMLVREGTAGLFHHFLVTDVATTSQGLRVQHSATFKNAYTDEPTYATLSGELQFFNSFFFNNTNFDNSPVDGGDPALAVNFPTNATGFVADHPGGAITTAVDPQMDAFNASLPNGPNWIPANIANLDGLTFSSADAFFTATDYAGAFTTGNDWIHVTPGNSASALWITTAAN